MSGDGSVRGTANWGCDHETPLHMRLLCEVAAGALRHCATCGAPAWVRPGNYGWGEPRLEWKEAWLSKNHHERPDMSKIVGDWSKPRLIPWLPWNHPNLFVTSPREAKRVCLEWGIDPERGGFISEAHRERAQAAATKNTREAVGKLNPLQRHRRAKARARSRAGRR